MAKCIYSVIGHREQGLKKVMTKCLFGLATVYPQVLWVYQQFDNKEIEEEPQSY